MAANPLLTRLAAEQQARATAEAERDRAIRERTEMGQELASLRAQAAAATATAKAEQEARQRADVALQAERDARTAADAARASVEATAAALTSEVAMHRQYSEAIMRATPAGTQQGPWRFEVVRDGADNIVRIEAAPRSN